MGLDWIIFIDQVFILAEDYMYDSTRDSCIDLASPVSTEHEVEHETEA